MEVAKTIEEIRSLVAQARSARLVIGLAPTMGALHAGHRSLIDAARRECDFVVVSIFVNPTQFGPGEDLAKYPRTPDKDLVACEACGADAVFVPDADQMYPAGQPLTQVSASGLSDTLCGRSRPAHFAGVCTVVAKLLNIVGPDRAYFGAKDYQQFVIVRRMVADLNIPTEIVVCPTVREDDGLAMASRNAYLDAGQRRQAAELYASLRMAGQMIRRDRPPASEVIEAIESRLADRAGAGQVDYVQIVDPESLADVETTQDDVLIALAVKFGRARLIDNIRVDGTDKGQ